jgi:WD repeat-containing protein 48
MSKPLNLPEFCDVPWIDINLMTGIVISQVASDAASGWTPVYRRLYSTQAEDEDTNILEHEHPAWVLGFLLSNTVGGVVNDGGPTNWQKFNFMAVPWRGSDSSEDLPELLNNRSRLTANRWLRVRKILFYVSVQIRMCTCGSGCLLSYCR